MNIHVLTVTASFLVALLTIAAGAFAQAPTCTRELTLDCLYFPSTTYAFMETEHATTYLGYCRLAAPTERAGSRANRRASTPAGGDLVP